MKAIVLIRGAGDLATGVALRLHHSGFPIVMLEREKPLAVRRQVAFSEAIYSGNIEVEDVQGHHVSDWKLALLVLDAMHIPILIDEDFSLREQINPMVIIDARMLKKKSGNLINMKSFLIGLGPGFTVGENCEAIIETQRGHHLGRVLWQGSAAKDTGVPGSIASFKQDRVIRSPGHGKLISDAKIGDQLLKGDQIAIVDGQAIVAAFDGVLRGLIHPSVEINPGMKIGDLDPRNDPSYVNQVSDKALAIGGGVMEAILTKADLRQAFFRD